MLEIIFKDKIAHPIVFTPLSIKSFYNDSKISPLMKRKSIIIKYTIRDPSILPALQER